MSIRVIGCMQMGLLGRFQIKPWKDWIPEQDLCGLSYPEMQYRVHWCPFGELSQAASFEELEPATTTYPNELHAHHAAAVNHSYLPYIGPGPAATPRTSDNNNNTDDHPWNSHSNDHFPQLAVAPQYHHHHHHSPSFSLPGAHVVDGETDSSAARGISYPHPFLFSYRSNPRTSPAINVHQGSSTQIREHLHTPDHVFNHQRQHHANGPTLASPLVSVTRRGLLPAPPMPDQNAGFFIYPPPGSSGRHHEPETYQFRAWERIGFQISLSHQITAQTLALAKTLVRDVLCVNSEVAWKNSKRLMSNV